MTRPLSFSSLKGTGKEKMLLRCWDIFVGVWSDRHSLGHRRTPGWRTGHSSS